MKIRHFCLFVVFVMLSFSSSGQEWTERFTTNNPSTFKEIKESFESHWADKDVVRSQGYKPFKRWEWYWESTLMPDGSFPPSNHNRQAYIDYMRVHGSNSRSLTANWTSEGPNSSTGGYAGIGRINCIGFHPNNTNIIYAGAAGGGLWQSTDGGNNWVTHTDGLGTLGVSGIVVDENKPDIV